MWAVIEFEIDYASNFVTIRVWETGTKEFCFDYLVELGETCNDKFNVVEVKSGSEILICL